MKGYGEHLQYSVFVCDLDRAKKIAMCADLAQIVKHTIDSVAIVDLGEAGPRGALRFEFMGTHRPLPATGPRVL